MDFEKLGVPLRSGGGGCGPLECDRVDPRLVDDKYVLERAVFLEPVELRPRIYFLIKDRVIVYVGQSTVSIGTRVIWHASNGKVFDSYAEVPCPLGEINDWEAYFILKFKPVYNRVLPSNTKYMSRGQLKKIYGLTGMPFKNLVKKYSIKPIHWDENLYFTVRSIENTLAEEMKESGFDESDEDAIAKGGVA